MGNVFKLIKTQLTALDQHHIQCNQNKVEINPL